MDNYIGIFNCENVPVAGWGGWVYYVNISFRGAKNHRPQMLKARRFFSFVICVRMVVGAPRLNLLFVLEKIKICPKINGKCIIKTCFL